MNVLRGAKNYVTGALGLGSSGEHSGALDVMVVQHEDEVMACTPFHVRFSKVYPTNHKERVIRLRVNGRAVSLCMKLGAAGEAFFVERAHNPLRRDLVTSPLSSPAHRDGDGGDGQQRPWNDSAAKDNWSARQIRNYQLLSDLSSDDEAASYRESLNITGSRPPPPPPPTGVDSAAGASSSPTSSPTLPAPALSGLSPLRSSFTPYESEDSGTESAAVDRKSTVIGASGDGINVSGGKGNDDDKVAEGGSANEIELVGNGEGSGAAEVATGLSGPESRGMRIDGVAGFPGNAPVANSTPGAASAAATSGSSGGELLEDEGNKAGEKEGIDDVVRKGSTEWCEGDADGDEEDNADGDEDEDEADMGGRGEGREGEEGSWWWSWTWGALPVRRKPKSTRRKHPRRRKGRASGEGFLDAAGASPTVEDGSRPDRACTESTATPRASTMLSTSDSTKLLPRSSSASAMKKMGADGSDGSGIGEDGLVRKSSVAESCVPADGVNSSDNSDHDCGASGKESVERVSDGSEAVLRRDRSLSRPRADDVAGVDGEDDTAVTSGGVDSGDNPSAVETESQPTTAAMASVTHLRGGSGEGVDECFPSTGDDKDTVVTGSCDEAPAEPHEKEGGTPQEINPPKSTWIGRGASDDDGDAPSTRSLVQEQASTSAGIVPSPPADVEGGEARPLGQTRADGGAGLPTASNTVQDASVVDDKHRRNTPIIPSVATATAQDTGSTAEGVAATEPIAIETAQGGALHDHVLRENIESSAAPSTLEDGANAVAASNGAPEAASSDVPPGDESKMGPMMAGTVVASKIPIAYTASSVSAEAGSMSSPAQCVFPGDDAPAMRQMIVAVETVAPDVEAWLTGEPSAAKVFDAAFCGESSDGGSVGTRTPHSPPTPPTQQPSRFSRSDAPSPGMVSDQSDPTTAAVVKESRALAPSPVRPLVGSSSQASATAAELAGVASSPLPPVSGGAGPPTSQGGSLVASPSGSSMGSTVGFGTLGGAGSRNGSAADLRGFHTPHGGSFTDLCELSVLTGSSASEGMGQAQHDRLFAAVGSGSTTPTLSTTTPAAASTAASLRATVEKNENGSGRSTPAVNSLEAARETPAASSTAGATTHNSGSSWGSLGTTPADSETRNAPKPIVAAAAATEAAEAAAISATEEESPAADETLPVSSGSSSSPSEGVRKRNNHAGEEGRRHFGNGVVDESNRGGGARLSSTMPGVMPTAADVAAGAMGPLRLVPAMSLSGHLISPEVRRGEGGQEAYKCARKAFVSELVTWHHFSRSAKEILKDPRLLVLIDGRLLSFSDALPHLVSASVFGRSLIQPPRPIARSHSELTGRSGTMRGDGHIIGGLGGGGGGGGTSATTNGDRSSSAVTVASENGHGNLGDSIMSRAASAPATGGHGNDDNTMVVDPVAAAVTAAVSDAVNGDTGVDGEGRNGAERRRGDGQGAGEAGLDGEEDNEATGTWWGVGGWFARRSGASPPPPSTASGAGVVDGVAGGATSVDVDGAVREGERNPSGQAAAVGRTLEYEQGGAEKRRVGAPPSLSINLVGSRRGSLDGVKGAMGRGSGSGEGDGGGEHEDDDHEFDEDEDIYGKTLRPTSEQLAALGLRQGCNTMEFVANVAGQAERVVTARVFLWSSGAKVVVSDIEGTIARSGGGRGVGSFTPVVGPGVHKDVSTLFTKVAANGYKILYLTSRPLGDWHARKGLEEGGGLPRGPVLCSPEALFRDPSYRDRRSHHQEIFKMTALRGLKLVFPADVNPLYAGFGSSVSDMVAYKKMSVPEGRIFLSSSHGGLHKINHTYRQTYLSLSEHVDLTFPPLPHDGADDEDTEDYDDGDDSDRPDGPFANAYGNDSSAVSVGRYAAANGGNSGGDDVGVAGGGGGGELGEVGGGDGAGGNVNGARAVGHAASPSRRLPLHSDRALSGASVVAEPAIGVDPGGTFSGAGRASASAVGGGGNLNSPRGSSASNSIPISSSGIASGGAVGGGGGGNGGSGGSAVGLTGLRRDGVAMAVVAAVALKKAPKAKREKSFYPNRAAVEDRFTDLNYWRDPPPLIEDDEDDDDEDSDGGEDEDDDHDEGDLMGDGGRDSSHM